MSFANLAAADFLCWGADWLVAFQEFPIVSLYDGLDVFGAAVGQLLRIPVENFAQGVGFGEVLVH